ncbi:MAG TPA: gluconate 2-dehydrogenase subunit 3 family protein [Microlunatus sp.]|nr:gluconate 2-dehydrogenase subunit 3 family protein [Microlunatus sp.]
MADTFLDAHQRETIEAAMARIIPTDDTPGAREAGTIDFLDRYLSGIDYIYALPDGSGFETLTGPRALAWQQRVDHARSVYIAGVLELDRRADDAHGRPFVGLDEAEQDEILRGLERGTTAPTINYGGPEEPALQQTNAESDLDFFGLLVTHTRQGFLADPIYGGNRGQVGWQTIGFPGPKDLAAVHTGQYTTRQYFSDNPIHRSLEERS